MKNHRKTGAMRLLALVLFLVVVAPAAFAQVEPDTSFPFLSIDTAQLNSLRTAFMFQWGLFNGYNGGGPQALYYVALAAALVGALAIVFNKALHSTKVIASWLLICVVCLFAPYNSKLLFYPIEKPGVGVVPGQMVGGEVKGFTPQLVAAHVGTTLQIIFSDMFNSAGFKGLVEGIQSEVELSSVPDSCPGEGWLQDANKFNNCATQILPTALQPGSDSSGRVSVGNDMTNLNLQKGLSELEAYFARDIKDASAFSSPPPLIAIPDDASEIPGTDLEKTAYLAKLNQLTNRLFSKEYECIQLAETDCSKGITYDRMISLLKNHTATQRSAGNVDSLGFYMATRSQAANPGILRSMQENLSRQCRGAISYFDSCDEMVSKVRNEFLRGNNPNLSNTTGGAGYNDKIGSIKRFLSTESGKDVAALPIQTILLSTTGGQAAISNNECSAVVANDLFNRIRTSQNPVTQDGYVFRSRDNLGYVPTRLNGYVQNGNYPTPGNWTPQDLGLTTGNEAMAQRYLNYFNKNPNFREDYAAAEKAEEGGDRLAKQRLLASVMVDFAKKSCTQKFASPSNQQALNQLASMDPTNKGAIAESNLGVIASAIVEALGKIAVIIGSFFAGIFAGAVINIMKSIVDMMMMMVILVTPIAFLFGIAMPNHAAGLLIQSVLVVGILKLVPVTFVVVDRMGDVIYRAISASPTGSSWFGFDIDVAFKQGIFLFGIATIYTGLVGMTMFLLFKVGDPGNIQKLAEIDKAADKVVDTGKKIAAALAATGALILGGGVAGAMGHGGLRKTMQDQAFKGLTNRMGVYGAAAQAAKEELRGAEADKDKDDKRAEASKMFEAAHGFKPQTDEELGVVESATDQLLAGDSLAANDIIKGHVPEGVASYASGSVGPVTPSGWTPGSGPAGTPPAGTPPSSGTPPPGSPAGTPSGGGTPPSAGPGGADAVGIPGAGTTPIIAGQPAGPGQGVGSVAQMNVGTLSVGGANAQLGTAQSGSATVNGDVTATGSGSSTKPGQIDSESGLRRPTNFTQQEWDQTLATNAKIRIDQAEAFAEIGALERSGDAVGAAKARVALYEKLQAKAELDRNKIKAGVLEGEFKVPSFLSTVGSGLTGGFEAAGGVGDIPYVGKILKGSFNEFHEAGERARAWMNVGGRKEYKKLKSAAKRGGYYDEMMNPVGKGEQYIQGSGMGNAYFQGAVANARQSASLAAAKQYDTFQAQKAATKIDGKARDDSQVFFTAEEMRGAQMNQALQSVMQVRQTAAQIQTGTIKVAGGEVVLNADSLRELVGSKATKAVAGELNELFVNHYYLMEKDGRDAYQTASRTRNNVAAINKFVREDVDMDYMVEADYKRFTGKRAFFGQREMVKAFLQLEGLEMQQKNDIKTQLLSATPAMRVQLGKQLNDLKMDGPLSRIYNQSASEQYSNMVMSSARAKGWQQDLADLDKQVKNVSKEATYGKNFDGGVSNLMKFLRSIGGLNRVNIDSMETALDDLRLNRHSRSIFSDENQLTTNGERYIRSALHESNFTKEQIDDIMTLLKNKGNRLD